MTPQQRFLAVRLGALGGKTKRLDKISDWAERAVVEL